MIFLRWDRSHHLGGSGPNWTGPNPSARPVPNSSSGSVPTPQSDLSLLGSITGINWTGPNPQQDRSQPLTGTGPNPSI